MGAFLVYSESNALRVSFVNTRANVELHVVHEADPSGLPDPHNAFDQDVVATERLVGVLIHADIAFDRDLPKLAAVLQRLLGLSRIEVGLKDYLDLSVLLERETLDIDVLAQAITATFERRGMAVPAVLPVGLTDEFAQDASRQSLWQAFLKKNELISEPLAVVVDRLRTALGPALNRVPR